MEDPKLVKGASKFRRGVQRYRFMAATDLAAWYVVAALTTIALVFYFSNGSVFEQLEYSLLGLASILFLSLTYGLYHGYALKGTHRKTPTENTNDDKWWDALLFAPDLGPPIDFDLETGCIGSIISMVVWFFISIFISLIFVSFLGAVLAMLTAVFWIFIRALRVVFIRSRVCNGDLGRSASFALIYTVLYTGWMGVLVVGAEMLIQGG